MISEIIKIPKERIAVLIGENGKVKREIQKKGNVTLEIDSEEGEVEVISETGNKYIQSTDVVKAIARGFNPEKAMKLFDDDYMLRTVNIKEYVGKNKSQLEAKKGRIIGRKGSAREQIEEDTNTKISVYGKTVCIIGKFNEIEKAERAIEMLIKGSSHDKVYSYLKKSGKEKFRL